VIRTISAYEEMPFYEKMGSDGEGDSEAFKRLEWLADVG